MLKDSCCNLLDFYKLKYEAGSEYIFNKLGCVVRVKLHFLFGLKWLKKFKFRFQKYFDPFSLKRSISGKWYSAQKIYTYRCHQDKCCIFKSNPDSCQNVVGQAYMQKSMSVVHFLSYGFLAKLMTLIGIVGFWWFGCTNFQQKFQVMSLIVCMGRKDWYCWRILIFISVRNKVQVFFCIGR